MSSEEINNANNDGNSEKIFEIIQSIQEKLNTSNNSTNNYSSPSKDSNAYDFMKKNVVGNTDDYNLNNSDSISSILSNLNIDMGTIMKIQRAFSTLNKDDPRKNLLNSLKPFLRETRQRNVDTYITFLGIINALGSFGENN